MEQERLFCDLTETQLAMLCQVGILPFTRLILGRKGSSNAARLGYLKCTHNLLVCQLLGPKVKKIAALESNEVPALNCVVPIALTLLQFVVPHAHQAASPLWHTCKHVAMSAWRCV